MWAQLRGRWVHIHYDVVYSQCLCMWCLTELIEEKIKPLREQCVSTLHHPGAWWEIAALYISSSSSKHQCAGMLLFLFCYATHQPSPHFEISYKCNEILMILRRMEYNGKWKKNSLKLAGWKFILFAGFRIWKCVVTYITPLAAVLPLRPTLPARMLIYIYRKHIMLRIKFEISYFFKILVFCGGFDTSRMYRLMGCAVASSISIVWCGMEIIYSFYGSFNTKFDSFEVNVFLMTSGCN